MVTIRTPSSSRAVMRDSSNLSWRLLSHEVLCDLPADLPQRTKFGSCPTVPFPSAWTLRRMRKMSGDASAVEASLAVADPFAFAGDEALTYPAPIMIGTAIESLTSYRDSSTSRPRQLLLRKLLR